MNRLIKVLHGKTKPLILGMIHLRALPGSPKNNLRLKEIIEIANKEADVLLKNRIDGLIVENMHDVPYVMSTELGPETVTSMTVVCQEMRRHHVDVPLGVQILAGCNREAIATALAADLDFIRAEGYIYSHIADEGLMNACAGALSRYRKAINAEHISIFTDIKKKHSAHSITADVSITEMARDAQFFSADGLIITGSSTAQPADQSELSEVKKAVTVPVFIGSGITADNLSQYAKADALIIGSYFKKEGKWYNDLDEARIKSVVKSRDSLST